MLLKLSEMLVQHNVMKITFLCGVKGTENDTFLKKIVFNLKILQRNRNATVRLE